MNINDINLDRAPDSIAELFEYQQILITKYDQIENEVLGMPITPKPPYNLDNPRVQYRIKDMFWRATEELAEAVECQPDRLHVVEEVMDALHFLVEACIIANLGPEHVQNCLRDVYNDSVLTNSVGLDATAWNIVFYLGLAANCLKNKPHKQTQVPTDKDRFYSLLLDAWDALFKLMFIELRLGPADIYSYYAKKWEVNKWRQDTKY